MSNVVEVAKEIMTRYKAAVSGVDDEIAVTVPELYDHWSGKSVSYVANKDRRRYLDKLYKCRKSHTSQEDWTPDKTPDLWTVIDVSHAGTIEDPIPASRGMEYTYGLYYLDPEDSLTYLCERQGSSGTIILQYLPHELVGQYFEIAE